MTYSLYLILACLVLVCIKPTRRVTLALIPWLIFACSYDWMRLLPNYEVAPIDIRQIYDAELTLFGVNTADGTIIPGQWFAMHNTIWADLLAGFFYLCWVPVPLGYAIYLYFSGQKRQSLRFSIGFLWVNILGFALYYVHPAAPPWYALEYGFTPQFDTPGSVAGLSRFDELMPFPIFANIYSGNSNVFAAVPSLHSAYVLTAAIYAALFRSRRTLVCAFSIITIGIWCTAVYTTHHYIIDVLLGIAEAIVAIAILEGFIFRIPCMRKALDAYVSKI